jgi:hypothetical protein
MVTILYYRYLKNDGVKINNINLPKYGFVSSNVAVTVPGISVSLGG